MLPEIMFLAGLGGVSTPLLSSPFFPSLGLSSLGLNVLDFLKPALCSEVSGTEEEEGRAPALGLMVCRGLSASDFSDFLPQVVLAGGAPDQTRPLSGRLECPTCSAQDLDPRFCTPPQSRTSESLQQQPSGQN